MSTTTLDPVERLLDSAEQGNTIIKNPNVLRHDYIPETNFTQRQTTRTGNTIINSTIQKINTTKPVSLW